MTKKAHARAMPARPTRGAMRSASLTWDDLAAVEALVNGDDQDEESVEELLKRVLLIGEAPDLGNPDHQNLFAEFAAALDEARIDANSGDPTAQRELKGVRVLLDRALQSGAVHPFLLILFGRLFASAGLDIGETARAAIRGAVKAGALPRGADLYRIFVTPVLAEADDDPFLLYATIDHTTAIFPQEERIAVAAGLAADANPLARQTALGFFLNSDEGLAAAAIKALAQSRDGLDGPSRQRLETIRPWLSPQRRAAVEAAFGPPPTGYLDSPAASRVKIVRLWASVRDGAGVNTIFALLKRGSRFVVISILIKPEGVVDVLRHEDLSRDEAEMMEFMLESTTPSNEIRIAAFARILRLALGRNLASKVPPPFSLVAALETLPLGPLPPDLATTGDLIRALLADVVDRDRRASITRAHKDVAHSEISEGWFEAGEEVGGILESADSESEAISALLQSYLPARREFWAAQCAHSALALKDGVSSMSALWRQFALVARDIAGDKPLETIPLMRQIAERSIEAHFAAE